MSDNVSALLGGGLSSSRDGNDRPRYQERRRDYPNNNSRFQNNYNSNGRGRDRGYNNNGNNYNNGYSNSYNGNGGGRYGGRGGGGAYRDNRPPPPPPGGPGYDRALQAQRPRFGSTAGGRGRGRGPRLPGNVKERTNQVFVSEQVMLSKEIITRLGDFRADPNDPAQMLSDMREMAEVLVSTDDLKQFRDDMSELFTKCMSQLSVQGPLIATLLALISKANNEFPLFIVDKMVSIMRAHISKGQILHAKLLLRCVAVLASAGALALGGDGGFESLIDALLCAAEPRAGDSSGSFSFTQQAMTYLLASATPHMGALLVHSTPSLAVRCRAVCQRVLSEWKSPFDTNGKNAVFNVNTIMLEDSSQGPEDMACWDTLWESCCMAVSVLDGESAATGAVGVAAPDGMHVNSSSYVYPSCFLRPWTQINDDMSKPFELVEAAEEEVAAPAEGEAATPVVASLEAPAPVQEGGLLRFKAEEAGALAELLSSSELEDTLRAGCSAGAAASGKGVFSWLCAKFPVFDAETGPNAATCVGLSFFEKYFMSDAFRDIFFFFQPYIRDDGTHIGTVDQVAAHQLAAFKLFPEDTSVHLEYILVETLLLLLVQVPPACASGVYCLILELCKKSPKIPPAVASVTGVLAQLFPAMDSSAWRGVTRWLCYHLTNTKLAWPFWDYWANEFVESPKDSVHRAFMSLLVDHCSRAVPAQKLRNALPQGVQTAIIEDFAPAVDDVFSAGAEGALAAVAKAVYQKIDTREDPDEFQEWLEEAHDGVDDALETEAWRVGLFMKAILIVGSRKTLSQLVSLIEKYRDPLREMGESDGAQKAMMDACISVMGHDMGFAAIVLDVVIRRGVIKPATLATYVCGEDVIAQLATENHVYTFAEVAVDRSLDMANALVATRKTLVGKGLLMEGDESADARPKDYSGAVTHVMSMGGGGGPSATEEKDQSAEGGDLAGGKRPREEEETEENEDGDDEDARRRRRRKFDEEEKEGGIAETAPASVGDAAAPSGQLAVVDTALASALKDCRAIYSKVLATLMVRLSRRQRELSAASSGADDEDVGAMLDPWCMSALSLIRTVLRSFHSAQESLAVAGDNEHKVCDADSVQFEISDVEMTPQLRAVWSQFSGQKM